MPHKFYLTCLMDLLCTCNQELGQFLTGHSGISWLHDLHTRNYQKASDTLKNLAKEVRNVLYASMYFFTCES